METFRQRTLNHQLKKIGFGGLDDPELVHQLAFCVRDHEHFRKVLHAVEPEKRKVAYDTMRPHLNFEAWPLDRYQIAAQEEAELLQLPVTLQDGSIVAYKDYHGEQTSLEVMAEKAIQQAEQTKALTLTCARCTRMGKFPAANKIQAFTAARKAGWVFTQREEQELAICPKCPAVRSVRVKLAEA